MPFRPQGRRISVCIIILYLLFQIFLTYQFVVNKVGYDAVGIHNLLCWLYVRFIINYTCKSTTCVRLFQNNLLRNNPLSNAFSSEVRFTLLKNCIGFTMYSVSQYFYPDTWQSSVDTPASCFYHRSHYTEHQLWAIWQCSVHCWRTQPGRSRRLHGSQHGHNGTWRHWPALHKQHSRTGNMRLVLCNTVRMSNWHLVFIQICLKSAERCDWWRSIAISQAPTIYSTDIRTNEYREL